MDSTSGLKEGKALDLQAGYDGVYECALNGGESSKFRGLREVTPVTFKQWKKALQRSDEARDAKIAEIKKTRVASVVHTPATQ